MAQNLLNQIPRLPKRAVGLLVAGAAGVAGVAGFFQYCLFNGGLGGRDGGICVEGGGG